MFLNFIIVLFIYDEQKIYAHIFNTWIMYKIVLNSTGGGVPVWKIRSGILDSDYLSQTHTFVTLANAHEVLLSLSSLNTTNIN